MNQKKIQAIMKLLVTSVNTRLNASLTPSDCAHLLSLLSKKQEPSPVDRVVDKLAQVAQDAIEAFGDDLRKGQ